MIRTFHLRPLFFFRLVFAIRIRVYFIHVVIFQIFVDLPVFFSVVFFSRFLVVDSGISILLLIMHVYAPQIR